MGGELVGLPPDDPPERPSYTKLFWDAYPAYIAMGMPSDEYWDGDAECCAAYRKARDEKLKFEDAMLWRQGLYFYHALCSVAPYFNSLRPRKPQDYVKEPFGFEAKVPTEQEQLQGGLSFVKAWASRVNSMRKQNGT